MNLVIDIGNTRIKLATFENIELVDQIAHDHNQRKTITDFIQEHEPCSRCIISAVTDIPDWLSGYLKSSGIDVLILDSSTPIPFENNYLSKETLGNDRIASVAGALSLYPKQNVLIINAGTAITYDIKTEHEIYPGGNISPGMTMRFKALHDYTAKLPLLSYEPTNEIIGRNTREAIINGVQNGIITEMEGTILEVSNKYPELIVILTGGDAHLFENKLKRTIFVISELTLLGLNYILEFNAKKH